MLKLKTRFSFNPYHFVPPGLVSSLCGLICLPLTVSLVAWMAGATGFYVVLASLVLLVCVMLLWFNLVWDESKLGSHTLKVQGAIKWGMVYFILSEVFFFLSFFWSFFHSSLNPVLELGFSWPPTGLIFMNPLGVPILNTVILLGSSVLVTWSHNLLLEGKITSSYKVMLCTCALGAYFTGLQLVEYLEVGFSMSDSVYGSVFFLITGFHGLHVVVGSVLLVFSALRLGSGDVTPCRHVGVELSIWYWHFVDVIWLYVYSSVYWWGV